MVREDGVPTGVALVETAGDGPGQLHVGEVVLPDRDHVGLAEEYVAGLVDRVGQQQAGQGVAAGLHLGLDGGVAVKLGLGHQGEEGQQQLVLCRGGRMGEDHGLPGVDARSQIVQHQVEHVVADMLGGVTVRDDLVVGDDDVGVHAAILHLYAFADGTEVMAQMEPAGRAVAGQHGVAARILVQLGQHLVGPMLGGSEAVADLVACRCDFSLHGPTLAVVPNVVLGIAFMVKVRADKMLRWYSHK